MKTPKYTMETRKCPYCESFLPQWRFDFVKSYGKDQEVISAALANNPDLDSEHAVYHIPEEF